MICMQRAETMTVNMQNLQRRKISTDFSFHDKINHGGVRMDDKKSLELDCLNSAIDFGMRHGTDETKRILEIHDCEDIECAERPDFIRRNEKYNCLLGIEHFRVDHFVKKKRGKVQSTGVMNKKEISDVYNTHKESVLASDVVPGEAIDDIMKTVSNQIERKSKATYKNFLTSFESSLRKHQNSVDVYKEKLEQIKNSEDISITFLIEVYTDFSELFLNRYSTKKMNLGGLMPFFKDIVNMIGNISCDQVHYYIFYLKNYSGSKEGVYAFDNSDLMDSFRKQNIDIYEYTGILIKMQQEDGRGHSTIKTVRGVLRPAFQMAVDDDVLMKNPFQFELAGVVVNDAVTREAISKDQMRKFLKFIHDDVVYCKYYEVIYILFHTGMRISEFCGLTMRDIDLEKRTININHQLQRTSKREYVIEPTKTNAGTRVIPMTNEVTEMFRAIIEDRPDYKVEKVVDGYTGFLFLDKDGMPLVAMHWEHRFNHMVSRYNEIYKVQMPNITPHVCRHTYCSNMAKSGMNPKTLQYLMGHSDIAVTLNVYTHVGLEDAEKELQKMQGLENARKEMGISDTDDKPLKQNMFKVV